MKKRDIDIICNNFNDWEMYRNKTILITGATGRLGRYILEALVEVDTKYDLKLKVIGLVRSLRKVESTFEGTMNYLNVIFFEQDINVPIQYDGNIDYIFHTAGPASPADFRDIPVETLWTHVNGTHNILECARTHNTKRVFYVSTVEVYGAYSLKSVIREQDMGSLHNLSHRASYPEAKRLCETMLASYKEEYDIDYCGVRLSHTLGPGIVLDDGRAFAEFMQHSLKGEDIILHSDGSAMRTYTYVADAVSAMFIVMARGESCFYNVSAEENLICMRDLAELVAGLSPYKTSKVCYSELGARLPYLPYKLPIMDTTRIRNLGWKPYVGLKDIFLWTMAEFE